MFRRFQKNWSVGCETEEVLQIWYMLSNHNFKELEEKMSTLEQVKNTTWGY